MRHTWSDLPRQVERLGMTCAAFQSIAVTAKSYSMKYNTYQQ